MYYFYRFKNSFPELKLIKQSELHNFIRKTKNRLDYSFGFVIDFWRQLVTIYVLYKNFIYIYLWYIFSFTKRLSYTYYITIYWEYKLIQSVFLCIYFKTKWMNRSIKVMSIAAYYFFPSLRQFSNSISKKWLVFGGDPILEPIFDFCERSESVTCILRNNQ